MRRRAAASPRPFPRRRIRDTSVVTMTPGPELLQPGLRRLRAPNPSPMTERGTNTYLLGATDLAIIDPGPDDPAHLDAILASLAPGQRIVRILVTHPHRDHSALAPRLAAVTGAPVWGFGPAGTGRSPTMARLAAGGLAGGGEGVDRTFAPDLRVAEGATLSGPDWRLQVIEIPGHMAGHLGFILGDAIFTGDTVMGWASSLVSPPDGDVTAFLASCRRLAALRARVLLPGHGDVVADPATRLAELVAHREARDAQIRAHLARGPATIPDIVAALYADTPPALRPAAERNVFAHLIAAWEAGGIRARPALSPTATFALP